MFCATFKSQFVIHTVGPVWNGGNKGEREKLSSCYNNALQLCVDYNCRSIAFPNISTGIYRFSKKAAAEIAVSTVHGFLQRCTEIDKVLFVCFDQDNYDFVEAELQRIS